MPFTNEFKDRFVAPELSTFTSASIRDLSSVSAGEGNWLRSYLLNTATRPGPDYLTRQTLYNFLRRAETAFSEYQVARDMTMSYLARAELDAFSEYLMALSRWEVVLSQ